MLSESKSSIHDEHIIQFHDLVISMLNELVPAMIREELARITTDLIVKIQTQINGRNVDFPDVIQYIKDTIEEELRKAL